MQTSTPIRPAQPIRLYRHAISGHAHRVQLMLSLLDLPFDLVDVDLLAKAQKTPEFLALNAFGQVPVIQDGNVTLADSNAILVYLATRYAAPGVWLPTDALGAAQVQRWLSVAAGQIAFGPAVARLIQLFNLPTDPKDAIQRANQLFQVMDAHLQQSDYLVGSTPTIADIANYSYIAHAPEGNVALEPYPHLRAWLARIEALPGFVPMVRSRIGLAA
ncbi:MAG: glutathione S-transferase [Burkholderiales bacterium]|nr:glutathione S-transferase [Burkholderiales bacterium]